MTEANNYPLRKGIVGIVGLCFFSSLKKKRRFTRIIVPWPSPWIMISIINLAQFGLLELRQRREDNSAGKEEVNFVVTIVFGFDVEWSVASGNEVLCLPRKAIAGISLRSGQLSRQNRRVFTWNCSCRSRWPTSWVRANQTKLHLSNLPAPKDHRWEENCLKTAALCAQVRCPFQGQSQGVDAVWLFDQHCKLLYQLSGGITNDCGDLSKSHPLSLSGEPINKISNQPPQPAHSRPSHILSHLSR